jgi:hypothetical protein
MMKPFRYYESPHIAGNVYLIGYTLNSAGGMEWEWIDMISSNGHLSSGPMVLTSDWLIKKPSEETRKLIISAWFRGNE